MSAAECSTSTKEPTKKWSCSMCTYLNYESAKKCTVCQTPRGKPLIIEEVAIPSSSALPDGSAPLRYGSDPAINGSLKNTPRSSSPKQSSAFVAKALNKWNCVLCTYDNWPNATRCTMCQSEKTDNPRDSTSMISCSLETSTGRASEESELDGISAGLAATNIHKKTAVPSTPNRGHNTSTSLPPAEHYTSALDIYLRRFAGNDHAETLFFKAASSIAHREIQMINSVVDYLINEGNLHRCFTSFECRLLNSRAFFRVDFETGDSLIEIAKKCDCGELVKLMKRVSPVEDKLPCVINCAGRTRVYAKITKFIAIRNGNFNAQFIAHPYNFNILKFPMKTTAHNMEVMKILMRPSPGIPPTYVFVDCYDMLNMSSSNASNVVGRPASFLMKNRAGAHSLCDAVFQTMYGVCDRFNILRGALKYTMIRSAHFFKPRWRDQCIRIARDCGVTMEEEDLENDWEETMNAVASDDECLGPIHIWALAHVVCRPIVVVPMNEPIDLEQLEQPYEHRKQETNHAKSQRKQFSHICEGIYLPVLWGSQPISRSPLVVAFRNGLFYAVIVSDALYQRDQDVQRFLKIRRSRRYGDNIFRFLTMVEMENSNFLAQFIYLGPCTAENIVVRRDPHPFLYETLNFYVSWINALHCCDVEGQGEAKMSLLEQHIDSVTTSSIDFANYDTFMSVFTAKATNMLKNHQAHPHLNSPSVAVQSSVGDSGSICSRSIEPDHTGMLDSSEDEEEELEEDDDEVDSLTGDMEPIDQSLTSTLQILRQNRKKD
ncbi:ubiquitin thioesterase ZRANB1 [Ditylenchus destructor]|uniref:Ubiquitin thioesterase ZRANB1 n=1 Tax=Ditylenchus destructor TaxID=166010 RepID=A0AAD4ND97_9BILA|nr:ubiquitin thioesterase ZRANB1 [Ditylenchus destructor]